jgi:hypothetical protein
VTVADQEAPVLTCSDVTVCNDTGSCSATVKVNPTVTDNCGLTGPITCSPTSNLFPVGQTVVTCSQADLSGNVGTCTFSVTVTDCEPPTIACPADITATLAPGQSTLPVTYVATPADNCAVASQTCTPPSGSSFSAGTAIVTCQTVDAAGLTAQCSFAVTVKATVQTVSRNKCPIEKGDWKNHPATWPVAQLMLGGQVYSRTELIALLKAPTKGDASLILGTQLIAAKLSIANGSDPTPVITLITQADKLFSAGATKLPYRISPSTVVGQQMVAIASTLDQYNRGALTPNCVD